MPLPAKLIKILVLSNKFPYPLKDGGAIATYNMLLGLSKTGTQVSLLTFNTKKHFLKAKDFPQKQFEQIKTYPVFADTTPKFFPAVKNLLCSSEPYILTRFDSKSFTSKLNSILKKNTFDIIQVEGLYLLQYVKLIRKRSNALIAYRAHNVEHEIWAKLAENTNNFLLRYYLKNLGKRIKKYEQNAPKLFDLLITISENDLNYFKQLDNHKPSHTCPVGFNMQSEIKSESLKKGNDLYFIGSLDWLPNREALIWFIKNCWFQLNRQYPNLKLFIAGRNAPEDFAEKLNHENIVFKGEVEDAINFIRDKKIMIVPLQSGSGMRVKIIEAFLHKKAVVSTKLGAIGTKSTNNEQILIANHPKDFIDKIKQLLENEDLYEKIVNNAYNLVSVNFDIFKLSNSLLSFYEQELKKQK